MRKNVVIDLEFCSIKNKTQKGVMYMTHEIIQIGAVMMDERMNVLDEFCSYVKPVYTNVSRKVTKLTGITEKDVEDAPLFKEAMDKFTKWIGQAEGVEMYSWSNTDQLQIIAEMMEKQYDNKILEELLVNWNDAQELFGKKIGYSGSPLSLSTALSAVDFTFEGAHHDALSDARNTAKLYALLSDDEAFNKRAKPIISLFMEDEMSKATIGDILSDKIKMCAAIF